MNGDEISLRDLLIILLQKWWVVAIVFIVTIAASAALSFLSNDAYESRTLLLLETSSPLEILNALATSDVLIGSIISEPCPFIGYRLEQFGSISLNYQVKKV